MCSSSCCSSTENLICINFLAVYVYFNLGVRTSQGRHNIIHRSNIISSGISPASTDFKIFASNQADAEFLTIRQLATDLKFIACTEVICTSCNHMFLCNCSSSRTWCSRCLRSYCADCYAVTLQLHICSCT